MASPLSGLRRRGTTGLSAGFRLGFRSGLEKTNADLLERLGVPVKYETRKVEYDVPAKRHRYTADFELPNGVIVETKGLFAAIDRAKHLFIREQYPDLDVRLVFSNPNAKIAKGSPTSYAIWCEKYGIKYAAKVIPLAWIHEAGPPVKPDEVLRHGPYGYRQRTVA